MIICYNFINKNYYNYVGLEISLKWKLNEIFTLYVIILFDIWLNIMFF